MPILLEPDQRYIVVLDCDKDKEVKPCFHVRAVSAREAFQTNETIRNCTKNEDVFELLPRFVVGWENMGGMDFAADSLQDVLTIPESWELLRAIVGNNHVGELEKKS